MQSIFAIILIAFIVKSNGNKLVPYKAIRCPSILPFKYKLQATVLDLDGKTNGDLVSCVMKNLYYNQSVLLITGYNTDSIPQLQKYKTTHNPNIIIMTQVIHPDVLIAPSVKRVLRSHRSIVYIAVTNSTLYNCKDGKLNDDEFTAIQSFMNKLWHRYKIMQAAVTFPVSCKDKVAVYSEKTNMNRTLYDRTIKLINRADTKLLYDTVGQSGLVLTKGYPLKADIFPRFPTVIDDCKNLHYYTKMNLDYTKGYCGLDALVMHSIVKHFKFKLYYPKDNETCDKYGYAMPNNLTGSLGCVVRNELDISFNARFMTMYSEDSIYFLHYISIDQLCAVIKKASVIPIWHYPFTVYDLKISSLITALVVLIGIIMWAMATIKRQMIDRRREALYSYIIDAITSTMCGFSIMHNKYYYMLRGTCLCSSFLFLAIFQGHINHMFTALLRYETINNLDSLYKSDTTLYVSQSMKNILKNIEKLDNQLQIDYFKRARLAPTNNTMDFILQHPQAVLLLRKQDTELEILSKYTDKHSSPLINIVNERFYTFYLNYIARAGFPFYEELQRFMQRMGEAGLPLIYHKWTCNMLRVPQTLPKVRTEPRSFEKIKLEDQRVAFGLLTVGYVVSFIVFIVEIMRDRHIRRACKVPKGVIEKYVS